MDTKLLDVLVCPVTKTSLVYREAEQELWCRSGVAVLGLPTPYGTKCP